jgi:hypothetical protein
MVAQTIDGTTITVDYHRPQARGRTELFVGDIVHEGGKWTPGANWATTFETNKDITLNGHAVAAGKYSVWFAIRTGEPWIMILDPQPLRFHLAAPPDSDDQVRFSVEPSASDDFVEVLTWDFPAVRGSGATLRFAWGSKTVSLDVGVPPSREYTVAASDAERYVGQYRLHTLAPLPDVETEFTITYENEHLVSRWSEPPAPGLREMWLLPQGEGIVIPAELEDGEVFDVVTFLALEFDLSGGPASAFELWGPGEAHWGSAERVGP